MLETIETTNGSLKGAQEPRGFRESARSPFYHVRRDEPRGRPSWEQLGAGEEERTPQQLGAVNGGSAAAGRFPTERVSLERLPSD